MKTSKTITSLLISALLILLTGCEKQPKSSFSMDKNKPMTKDVIKFSNTTENGESYEWDFGDGEKSSDKEPSHTYNKRGEYSIKMIAKSKSGKKADTTSQKIKVSGDIDKILGTFRAKDKWVSSISYIGSGELNYTVDIIAGDGDDTFIMKNLNQTLTSVAGYVSGNVITFNVSQSVSSSAGKSYFFQYGSGEIMDGGTILKIKYSYNDLYQGNAIGIIISETFLYKE